MRDLQQSCLRQVYWGDMLPLSLSVISPTHPVQDGHWGGPAEKGQSWPALSPCSTGPAWSHPAGWPESCSHYGLLGTGDGGDQFRC